MEIIKIFLFLTVLAATSNARNVQEPAISEFSSGQEPTLYDATDNSDFQVLPEDRSARKLTFPEEDIYAKDTQPTINQQRQYQPEVHDDDCICNRRIRGKTVPVSKNINPEGNDLQRVVVYLYSKKGDSRVYLYVPDVQKQHYVPDLPLEDHDLLQPLNYDLTAKLLVDSPYAVTKKVFDTKPDYEAKVVVQPDLYGFQHKLSQLGSKPYGPQNNIFQSRLLEENLLTLLLSFGISWDELIAKVKNNEIVVQALPYQEVNLQSDEKFEPVQIAQETPLNEEHEIKVVPSYEVHSVEGVPSYETKFVTPQELPSLSDSRPPLNTDSSILELSESIPSPKPHDEVLVVNPEIPYYEKPPAPPVPVYPTDAALSSNEEVKYPINEPLNNYPHDTTTIKPLYYDLSESAPTNLQDLEILSHPVFQSSSLPNYETFAPISSYPSFDTYQTNYKEIPVDDRLYPNIQQLYQNEYEHVKKPYPTKPAQHDEDYAIEPNPTIPTRIPSLEKPVTELNPLEDSVYPDGSGDTLTQLTGYLVPQEYPQRYESKLDNYYYPDTLATKVKERPKVDEKQFINIDKPIRKYEPLKQAQEPHGFEISPELPSAPVISRKQHKSQYGGETEYTLQPNLVLNEEMRKLVLQPQRLNLIIKFLKKLKNNPNYVIGHDVVQNLDQADLTLLQKLLNPEWSYEIHGSQKQPEGQILGPIFDKWFEGQVEDLEDKFGELNIASIKVLIERILHNHNLMFTKEGILIDKYGNALNVGELKIRPILIGNAIDVGIKTLLEDTIDKKIKIASATPYLQGLLVSLGNPPQILGLIPLGFKQGNLPMSLGIQKTPVTELKTLPDPQLETHVLNPTRPNIRRQKLPQDDNLLSWSQSGQRKVRYWTSPTSIHTIRYHPQIITKTFKNVPLNKDGFQNFLAKIKLSGMGNRKSTVRRPAEIDQRLEYGLGRSGEQNVPLQTRLKDLKSWLNINLPQYRNRIMSNQNHQDDYDESHITPAPWSSDSYDYVPNYIEGEHSENLTGEPTDLHGEAQNYVEHPRWAQFRNGLILDQNYQGENGENLVQPTGEATDLHSEAQNYVELPRWAELRNGILDQSHQDGHNENLVQPTGESTDLHGEAQNYVELPRWAQLRNGLILDQSHQDEYNENLVQPTGAATDLHGEAQNYVELPRSAQFRNGLISDETYQDENGENLVQPTGEPTDLHGEAQNYVELPRWTQLRNGLILDQSHQDEHNENLVQPTAELTDLHDEAQDYVEFPRLQGQLNLPQFKQSGSGSLSMGADLPSLSSNIDLGFNLGETTDNLDARSSRIDLGQLRGFLEGFPDVIAPNVQVRFNDATQFDNAADPLLSRSDNLGVPGEDLYGYPTSELEGTLTGPSNLQLGQTGVQVPAGVGQDFEYNGYPVDEAQSAAGWPEFRIIGGNPATGSGIPLSRKGKSGPIVL